MLIDRKKLFSEKKKKKKNFKIKRRKKKTRIKKKFLSIQKFYNRCEEELIE